jgi:DNA-binding NarL/FixJ family response regulator
MPTTIVIVDDNAMIRKLIRSFIELHTDWEVCGEAGDGETAITLAKRLNPDLIVLDLSMPRKNGLEAARSIATVCPNSEMVLFTAHASDFIEVEAKRVGIRAVLSKEATDSMERLVSLLRQVCRKPAAA